MGWSFLDFTGLSRFFGRLPEKLVTTDTTQTIPGTKSFSSTILGSVSGSAASAAKDGAGNVIADTYETKADAATHLSKSDAASTYLSKADAASAYVQTGAVDQTIAGTKTFSKPMVGSVTGSSGSCTGNAATATKLAAKRTIALSGAATGTATSFDGSGNITIPVTALSGSAITSAITIYDLVPDGAASHRNFYRGKDLTAAFNAGTVSTNIANGTFRDIFPGDYITKSITVPQILKADGTTEYIAQKTYTVKFIIADLDIWLNRGDTATTAHHVAIVPQSVVFNSCMNESNVTTGGYLGSFMNTNVIPAFATGLQNAFGASHLISFRYLESNTVNTSVPSAGYTGWTGASQWTNTWASYTCRLLNETMVYGSSIFASSGEDERMGGVQMAAFRLNSSLVYNRQNYWLSDVVSSARFAGVFGFGRAHTDTASYVYGVRPFALLR